MSYKHESMIGIIKLYELRREATMREAREWFAAFYADSFQNIADILTGEDDRYFRMVLTYWDMAATFVNHGEIDEQMFNEANVEHIATFAKVEPFIEEFRQMTKNPHLLGNLEQLVKRVPDAATVMADFRTRAREKHSARGKAAAAA